MKTPYLFAALATAVLLAGCGQASVPSAKSPASSLQAKWGQKTWVDLTVPTEVMGHVLTQRDAYLATFDKDFGKREGIRMRFQLVLTASADGFKTKQTSMREVLHDMPKPHALAFDFPGKPGEYQYYLSITANAVEYDKAGNFRGIVKTYPMAYVSDFGKNFTATGR